MKKTALSFPMAFIFAIVVALLSPALINAQNPGKISGQVTDPSGGVVAGASVTLRNTAADIERQTVTDTNGKYEFTAISFIANNFSLRPRVVAA